MHLDTVCTMVDVDAIVMYPNVADTLHGVRRHRARRPDDDADAVELHVAGAEPFLVAAAKAMGIDTLHQIDTGLDPVTAEREQWDDGNNTLAIAPRVAVAYERNVETNARLEEAGIEVVAIAGSELGSRPRRPALHVLPGRPRPPPLTAGLRYRKSLAVRGLPGPEVRHRPATLRCGARFRDGPVLLIGCELWYSSHAIDQAVSSRGIRCPSCLRLPLTLLAVLAALSCIAPGGRRPRDRAPRRGATARPEPAPRRRVSSRARTTRSDRRSARSRRARATVTVVRDAGQHRAPTGPAPRPRRTCHDPRSRTSTPCRATDFPPCGSHRTALAPPGATSLWTARPACAARAAAAQCVPVRGLPAALCQFPDSDCPPPPRRRRRQPRSPTANCTPPITCDQFAQLFGFGDNCSDIPMCIPQDRVPPGFPIPIPSPPLCGPGAGGRRRPADDASRAGGTPMPPDARPRRIPQGSHTPAGSADPAAARGRHAVVP